jgi:diaminohydroxyphosphoribosylaminopyrimidine deaminase/5-amino-6-(5-phosphoribosylamino)uracil reductase
LTIGGARSATADRAYMARAIELARRGLHTTEPNPRVGCVVVADGEVVGEGWHQFAGGPHAEVWALRAAGDRARGATAYVTLEPCCHHGRTPPCSEALIGAGVARVVAAQVDPNPLVSGAGLGQLAAAGIEVESGLLAEEAGRLNPGFLRRMAGGRPWCRLKLAMSLDGRTAMASGESRWITGPDARRDVHLLRARSSAIITTSATQQADDAALDVRLDEETLATIGRPEGTEWRPAPLRVLLDRELRCRSSDRIVATDGRLIVFTASGQLTTAVASDLRRAGVELKSVPVCGGHIELPALFDQLAELGLNELLVEAGERFAGALLLAGLVDELILYFAPHLLGSSARGLVDLPGVERLDQRIGLEIVDLRAVGQDWRITARPRSHRS